jgi:aquaporin Z
MNPVRSLAPDLMSGDMKTSWIYVVGPVVGAIIAVGFEWMLRGKATAAGTIAAEGSLDLNDQ